MKKIFVIILICAAIFTAKEASAWMAFQVYMEARGYADGYQPEFAIVHFHRLVEQFPLSFFAPKALFAIGEYEFLKKDYFDSSQAFIQLMENYPRTREAMFAAIYLAKIYYDKKEIEAEKSLQYFLRETYFYMPSKKRYSMDTYRICFGFSSGFNHKYYARHYEDKVEFFIDDRPFYTLPLIVPQEKKQ